MQTTSEKKVIPVPPSALNTLKTLAKRHNKKLIITLLLVIIENIVYLLYPLLAGFAINAILKGHSLNALFYAILVLGMWIIGAARRSIDTRTFARIYASLAVPLIVAQRGEDHCHSTIAARVTLSRQFVDFFESHLPRLITSIASVCGAVVMLISIELSTGIACLVILGFFSCLLPSYTRKNEHLIERLNDRLEREVTFVSHAKEDTLHRHYQYLARIRIYLSDREATGFLLIGLAAALLFGMTIFLMAGREGISAGHIYSVMTYLWMFAMSLDETPSLLEKYSEIKEIGRRVNTGML